MNIEVTTVSKKEQKVSQSAAAIYVITQEDIRRSGMTSVPELLRMVPGLQVAQAQGGQWAVSARGFNDGYSNKLLVLLDGMTVYSPIYSGVFWDEQNILLETIERIEVVRGPGATLWGANAVNGVINIITKAARDTQGVLAKGGAGSGGQLLGGIRWGGALGDRGHYRVSTNYLHGRSLWNTIGRIGIDGQSAPRVGFRADLELSGRDSLSVRGDAFRTTAEYGANRNAPPFPTEDNTVAGSSGGSLIANWIRTQSDRSRTDLQVYFSGSKRSEVGEINNSTIDVDYQHELAISEANAFVWGVGFRDSSLHTKPASYASFSPPSRNVRLFSAFAQNRWTIAPNRLIFTAGSKIEHNDFTGIEIQPGASILWTPDRRQTLWASAARAIRAPAMLDANLDSQAGTLEGPGGIPIVLEYGGSAAFRAEHVLTYELGYRVQARKRLSLDFAAYHNNYTHLKTYETGAPVFEATPVPHFTLQTRFGNLMQGQTYGIEIASNLNVTERWRLIPSYSWLNLAMRVDPASTDTISRSLVEGNSPRHQIQFRSNLDISRKFQFDAAAYYTSVLRGTAVPAYTRLDARLGYRPAPSFEISLSGQNLQGGRHDEFLSIGPYARASIGRSVMLTVTWQR